MKTPCVNSLLRLQKALIERGVRMRFNFTSFAEVTAVRNLFGGLMLENEAASHLLFVDTDMAFSPETVFRLVEADRPVIGSFYASRIEGGGTVGKVARPTRVPRSGLIKVEGVGMGLALIQGEVFRKLAATGQLSMLDDHPFPEQLSGPLPGFFSPPPGATAYVSEDYAFCQRWRDLCGGEIWALVREDVGHVGDHTFRRRIDADLLVPTPRRPPVPPQAGARRVPPAV